MTRVVIVVEGGVVQEVFTDPAVKCIVIDHDNMKEEGRSELERTVIQDKATKDLDWAPMEDHSEFAEELANELKEE